MWRSRSADVRVWRSRSAGVRVWRSRSADVKVWRSRSAGVRVWRSRSADVRVWRPRSAGVKVWRPRSADVKVWRCRSADVRVWRSRSADVKVWRCSITAAFLRRTLRRRSREKSTTMWKNIKHTPELRTVLWIHGLTFHTLLLKHTQCGFTCIHIKINTHLHTLYGGFLN